MIVEVGPKHGYYELVGWFEEHVGRMLNSQPVILAAGHRWRLEKKSRYGLDSYGKHGFLEPAERGWTAYIDDDQAAVLFALRWL